MSARLQRLRELTNGYTVTPEQYVRFAYAGLIALTLIVLTGAAVRLTGSGLGLPHVAEVLRQRLSAAENARADRVLQPHSHRASIHRRGPRLACGCSQAPLSA